MSRVTVFPFTGTGLRLPLASGSPSSITWSTACLTAPFSSAMYSIGLWSVRNFIPSSFACFTSSSRAGISFSERRYTKVTSPPRRFAVRHESMAVFPPPTTKTCFPILSGVSERGLAASMRFTRVRYSFDDIMLRAFSPLMPMKFGNPAPEPTKTPLKPSFSNCSTDIVFPTMQSVWNFTPIAFRFSISTSTMWLGRRNSGMPYFNTPPISCKASKTCTSKPSFAMSPAKLSPDGPEPTTATLIPFDGFISGTAILPLSRS